MELEDVGIVADTAHCVCVLVDVVLVAAIVATNQRILHVYATLSMRLRIIRNFLSVPVLFLFVFIILCFLCHIYIVFSITVLYSVVDDFGGLIIF